MDVEAIAVAFEEGSNLSGSYMNTSEDDDESTSTEDSSIPRTIYIPSIPSNCSEMKSIPLAIPDDTASCSTTSDSDTIPTDEAVASIADSEDSLAFHMKMHALHDELNALTRENSFAASNYSIDKEKHKLPKTTGSTGASMSTQSSSLEEHWILPSEEVQTFSEPRLAWDDRELIRHKNQGNNIQFHAATGKIWSDVIIK